MAWGQTTPKQTLQTCLRQVGKRILPYNNQDTIGAVGAYRFSVNSLFDAGVCQGQAPVFVSYNWTLCDFKGPPAQYNKISNVHDLLQRPDVQEKLVQQNVILDSTRNKDLLLQDVLRPLQRFSNAPDLLGALLYRKGAAAVKLLALTDLNSFDALGYSTRDYINFYAQCAGDNTNVNRRTLFNTVDKSQQPSPALPTNAQAMVWQKLGTIPVELQEKILLKVPELRVVMGTFEKHSYAVISLGQTDKQAILLQLTGIDFCNGAKCTYYLFRNGFTDVVTFYAGQVLLAPNQNGLYIDGFYKPVEEIGK